MELYLHLQITRNLKQGGFMKAQNTKIITREKLSLAGLIIICFSNFIGCGASKTENSSNEFESRAPGALVATQSSDRAFAYCNTRQSISGQFSTILKSYQDSSGRINYQFMNMKFSKVPNDFKDFPSFLEIWRWQKNSQGKKYIDSAVPVYFKLVDTSTGVDLTSYMYFLRWQELNTIASKLGISKPEDFFQRVRLFLDLRDPQGQFDAINVVYYDQAGSTIDQLDMLLPIFDADPKIYANDPDGGTRDSELMALHPFYSRYLAGEQWNVKTYQTWANDLCVGI